MRKEYRESIEKELENLIVKYNLKIEDAIEHFSMFLAKWIVKEGKDRVQDALTLVHSFSRYVIALHLDESNDSFGHL